MRARSHVMAASFLVLSAAALAGVGCGSSGGGGADCTTLTNYTATVTTAPTLMNDIYPILSSTSTTGGCSQPLICHGVAPIALDAAKTKTLRFLITTDPVGDPGPQTLADVKAELLMNSVNAPSMMRVKPGDVGNSLLAYKISGKDLLKCADSMCVAGASVSNNTTTCGDPMPSQGTITAGDRTKLLDWIKLGAAD